MTDQHPITPPPELVQEWSIPALGAKDWLGGYNLELIATQAAQWGANQELEACCEWLAGWCRDEYPGGIGNLRAARRPKPLSLKKEAYAAIDKIERSGYPTDDLYTLRRALEQLPDHEPSWISR